MTMLHKIVFDYNKKKEKPLREKLNIWAPKGSQGNECDVSIRDTEGQINYDEIGNIEMVKKYMQIVHEITQNLQV